MDLENEQLIKRTAQWGKLDDKARVQALRGLLSTAGGRSYLYDVLNECGVFRSAFSSDALRMAYTTGQQSIGLWIMADIQTTDPQSFYRMIQERNQRNADRQSVIDTITEPGSTNEPVFGDPREALGDNAVKYPVEVEYDPTKYDPV